MNKEEIFNNEYERFKNSPGWELKNTKKALNTLPFFNTEKEVLRLKAINKIIKEKRGFKK